MATSCILGSMFDVINTLTFPVLVTASYILCATIQMVFSLLFGRLLFFKKSRKAISHQPNSFSVIVAARNEETNLKELVPLLMQQDYEGDYELIIVNDRSEDGSFEVLASFQKQYPKLNVVQLDENNPAFSPKKQAILAGIKSARYDQLLFTDADCRPASDQWLKKMDLAAQGEKKIVLGFSPYQVRQGFLNAFIRYETLLTAIQYLGMAVNGRPYMAVGRNWSVSRQLILEKNALSNHMEILSGDDDLTANAIATGLNTTIQIDKDAHVWSFPANSWRKFFKQKTRHFEAGYHYKRADQLWLGLWTVSKLGFYLSFTLLLWLNMEIALYGYMFKMFTFDVIIYYISKRLGGMHSWLSVVGYDAVYACYLPLLGILPLFKPQRSWK